MSDRAVELDPAPLRRLGEQFAADEHCPSLAWGVVLDGSLVSWGSVGDVSERTVYRIASMTKSFSAATTLALRDDGVLRLDDPVADHAPELATLRHADAAPITIRDLLTMTSGLPSDDPWADRHLDLTDEEFDRIVADGPLFAHATGDAWEYSNFGFAVLGRVVHRATGRRIQDLVTQRLLGPLGMTRTTWAVPDHDDWARPIRRDDDGHVDELPPLADGLIAPMGGLWTTVQDLATWISWLDDAFPARSGTEDGLLCRASRRAMQSPQRYVGARTLRGVTSPGSYGFGLQVVDEGELGTVVAHGGGLPGYGSNMRWLPGRRTGAVALANVTYAPAAVLTARLLDELHSQGLVPDETVPVSPALDAVAHRLVDLLNDWDDELATSLCTMSLVQDDGLDRRRAAAEKVTAEVGPLSIGSIDAVTAAQATIHCVGGTGRRVDVTFMLAPPSPPRIQSYDVSIDPSIDPSMNAGAD